MRWKGRRQSENVEDRRGGSGRAVAGGGLGVLIIAVVVMLLGGDPSALLSTASSGIGTQAAPGPGISDEDREFVSVVLADTEDVWREQFRRNGRTYREPRLVLFSGSVRSACGFAGSQVGPFYCGADQTVYLDTSFFQEMTTRFKVGGDFARAYVIAHEVGHHVQQLTGVLDQVNEARQRLSEREANALTVRLELQADFYAGVWAHHARQAAGIDEQDIREAMEAASAIGDDTLQMQSQGYVVPDAFTHGTSEQRMRWFLKGWKSGDMREGDTFRARDL
jgi:predicted metalloprotease